MLRSKPRAHAVCLQHVPMQVGMLINNHSKLPVKWFELHAKYSQSELFPSFCMCLRLPVRVCVCVCVCLCVPVCAHVQVCAHM